MVQVSFDDFYQVPNLKFDILKLRTDLELVLKRRKFNSPGVTHFGAIPLNQIPNDEDSIKGNKIRGRYWTIADETGKPYNEEDLRPLLKEIGFAATMIGATLQNTANPTMLEAGYKANVIPGSASAVVDGRFIPGFEDELNETIKSIIGEHVTVETITRDKALEVPFEGDLVEAMCNALIKEDAVAIPVPSGARLPVQFVPDAGGRVAHHSDLFLHAGLRGESETSLRAQRDR